MTIELHGKAPLGFKVVELKPHPAVLCLDTDIEVDIVPLDEDLAKAAVEKKHDRLEWKNNTLVLSGSTPSFYSLPTLPSDVGYYEFWFKPLKGDANLFLSSIHGKPDALNHFLYHIGPLEKRFCIEKSGFESFIHVGVHAFVHSDFKKHADTKVAKIDDSTPCEFTLQIMGHLTQPNVPLLTPQGVVPIPVIPVQGLVCEFCQQTVAEPAMMMHRIQCQRINTICPQCKQCIRKDRMATHVHCDLCDFAGDELLVAKHLLIHQVLHCTCGEQLTLPLVSEHCHQKCPDRTIICRFCHLSVRAGYFSKTAKDLILGGGLTEHESDCGARTISCQLCGLSVQLKDVQTHAQFHALQKKNQPIFKLCKNQNCCSPIDEQRPNTMKVCSSCFGPFWSAREDPNHQKLIQNLAAQYHKQLTRGCDFKACMNQYCCTSQDKTLPGPLEATDAAIQVMSLIKKCFAFTKDPEYFLCVADPITERRARAVQLMDLGFTLPWCVKALLECKGDANAAASWLMSNAPK